MPTRASEKPAEPRKRQPAPPAHGPNRAALETAVAQLATGPQHEALVELCRSLASYVDGLAEFDDKAFREYRMALGKLMEAGSGGGSSFDDELAELRAPLGDL